MASHRPHRQIQGHDRDSGARTSCGIDRGRTHGKYDIDPALREQGRCPEAVGGEQRLMARALTFVLDVGPVKEGENSAFSPHPTVHH